MDAQPDMSMSGMDSNTGSMSGMGSCSGMNMGMVMSFYWSTQDVPIVFPGWETPTTAGYWGSVVIIFFLSILFQFIFNFRLRFDSYFKDYEEMKETPLHHSSKRSFLPGLFTGRYLLRRLLRTIIFGLQVSLGYFLMLVVMTYNTMLALSVVLGYTTGYFLFSAEHISSDSGHLMAGEECH